MPRMPQLASGQQGPSWRLPAPAAATAPQPSPASLRCQCPTAGCVQQQLPETLRCTDLNKKAIRFVPNDCRAKSATRMPIEAPVTTPEDGQGQAEAGVCATGVRNGGAGMPSDASAGPSQLPHQVYGSLYGFMLCYAVLCCAAAMPCCTVLWTRRCVVPVLRSAVGTMLSGAVSGPTLRQAGLELHPLHG